MAEFDLIERIRARAIARDGVLLGIGDDAALLQVPAGHELAVTADTLNAGVHFPADAAPADIGWKALAVNLSDLASMGARPAWCTLSLSLPGDDTAWLDAFLDGFLGLADTHAVALVGGDTTRGPLSIAVTAMGWVEAGAALRRDGARPGDDVWVTGTLGDAAAALVLGGYVPIPLDGVAMPVVEAGNAAALRARLARPAPRVAVGRALAGLAHACVDVSDGLLADLGHIASRSGVAAVLQADAVPLSAALRTALGDAAALDCALRGGDDYELCFTAAPERRQAVQALTADLALPLARIGVIAEGRGVHCEGDAGAGRSGYRHFAE